jgi:membrane associated rhomboid family serine protease
MFIPLYDGLPLRHIRRCYVNWCLMLGTVSAWLLFQSGLFIDGYEESVLSFGLIPAVLFGTAVLPEAYDHVPAVVTLGTSLFLHGDLIHLGGNMLFLLVFGDNVEDAMGHLAYLVFYLVCGAAAGVAFAVTSQAGVTPLIGASGAVSGVIAAYLMLRPHARIWALLFMRVPARLAAVWVIAAWFLFQLANATFDTENVVAWWAHVGGFVTGAALVPLFKRPEVPLFEPAE